MAFLGVLYGVAFETHVDFKIVEISLANLQNHVIITNELCDSESKGLSKHIKC